MFDKNFPLSKFCKIKHCRHKLSLTNNEITIQINESKLAFTNTFSFLLIIHFRSVWDCTDEDFINDFQKGENFYHLIFLTDSRSQIQNLGSLYNFPSKTRIVSLSPITFKIMHLNIFFNKSFSCLFVSKFTTW